MNKQKLNLQQIWPFPQKPRPIVLIGAGGIVSDAHLPAYKKSKCHKVIGIYDIDDKRTQKISNDWGIPLAAKKIDQIIDLAKEQNCVFDIAVPPTATLPVLKKIPKGSTVLIQKPMGNNLANANQIVKLCRSNNLIAAVNHQLRFAPYMLAVRSAYEQGILGKMSDIEMQLNCADPWHLFPFLEKLARVEIQVHSIHYLDLIRSLIGEPKGVYALTIADKRFPKLKSTRSSIILNYGHQTRVCLSINHNYAHGEYRQAANFKFEGDKGVIWVRIGVMLDYPKGQPDLFEIKTAKSDWQVVKLSGTWFPDAFNGPMNNLQRFAAGEDKKLLTSVKDVLNTMKVVEAAYKSSTSGGVPIK